MRPRRDDPFEPDDDAAHELPGPSWASGLFGGRWRSSNQPAPLVTRGRDDVERFRVDAHDGTFDTFYVTVEVERIGRRPESANLNRRPRRRRTGVLASPGRVSVGGGGGHDDSGTYDIVVRPMGGELEWCPVQLTVSTG